MNQFKCIQCGGCCRNLEESESGAPGGLLLTPEETAAFIGDAGKDVIPTVGYTAPGDHDMQILYYGMINTTCPLYDEGCTVYEDRPLVCRRYPLGNDITKANSDCPVVQDGGVLFDEEVVDAMFDLETRSQEIMATVPTGSILYLYNVGNKQWDITGVKI